MCVGKSILLGNQAQHTCLGHSSGGEQTQSAATFVLDLEAHL